MQGVFDWDANELQEMYCPNSQPIPPFQIVITSPPHWDMQWTKQIQFGIEYDGKLVRTNILIVLLSLYFITFIICKYFVCKGLL